MGLLDRLRAGAHGVAALTLLPLAVVFWSAGALVQVLLGGTPRQTHRHYLGFAKTCLLFGGTKVELHGLENLKRGQAYVVVSNHESNWDPPTIIASLPDLVIRFVLKTQLLKVPVFGQALQRTGNIAVDRARTGADVKRLQEGMSARDPEVSILFFAEGNRSRNGAYGAFKMGAFVTALEQKLPILPIAVAGTIRVWPTGGIWVRNLPVALEVGEPIPVEGLSGDDRTQLRDRTHAAVGELRRRARARLRARGMDPGGTD